MNQSISLAPGAAAFSSVTRTGSNDQCPSKFAPWATHFSIRRISRSLNFLALFGGGIFLVASVSRKRASKSLISGLPGTTVPLSPGLPKSPSLVSNLKSDFRWAASGPWQKKQLSLKSGRISLLKRTVTGRSSAGGSMPDTNAIAAINENAPVIFHLR